MPDSCQRDGLLSSVVFKVQTRSPGAFVFRVHTCIIVYMDEKLFIYCKALVNLSRAFLKVIKMKSICAGKRSCVPVLVCLCVGSKASMFMEWKASAKTGEGIYIYIIIYCSYTP